jgi:hypothetical protein
MDRTPSERTPPPARLRPRRGTSLFALRRGPHGLGLYALRAIAPGERLFGPDDFVDAAERASFVDLPLERFLALRGEERRTFLRFAYSIGPALVRGTFRHEAARHPSNFINHSCEPNAGYDGGPADDIVAYRTIPPGGEIAMDYGTCSFGFDHDFACRCGAASCRGRVRGEDWRALARQGVALLGFMAPFAAMLPPMGGGDRRPALRAVSR